jgi:hypothetical protein
MRFVAFGRMQGEEERDGADTYLPQHLKRSRITWTCRYRCLLL